MAPSTVRSARHDPRVAVVPAEPAAPVEPRSPASPPVRVAAPAPPPRGTNLARLNAGARRRPRPRGGRPGADAMVGDVAERPARHPVRGSAVAATRAAGADATRGRRADGRASGRRHQRARGAGGARALPAGRGRGGVRAVPRAGARAGRDDVAAVARCSCHGATRPGRVPGRPAREAVEYYRRAVDAWPERASLGGPGDRARQRG